MLDNSVVSYAERGGYGKSSWRGNCSGRLIKDCLGQFRPKVFVDAMCGSNTSGDVVRELNGEGANIEYHGLDLHSGFNAVRDSIAEKIGGKRADWIFLHPPYASMVLYSGSVWGTAPHPEDLSHSATYEEFLMKMRLVMQNAYDALRAGARYSILIGDLRKSGEYTSIQADLQMMAPGKLDSIIIKTQHNCVSDRKNYANSNFTRISHEYLLTFRQDRLMVGFLDTSLAVSRRLGVLSKANWKATIHNAFRKLGEVKASLGELYAAIEETAPDTTMTRPNWKARIRAELQSHFRPIEKGVWALPKNK